MVFDWLADACFNARDHNGWPLACACFDDEKGRRTAAKLLAHNRAGPPKLASMLQTEITGATKLLERLVVRRSIPLGVAPSLLSSTDAAAVAQSLPAHSPRALVWLPCRYSRDACGTRPKLTSPVSRRNQPSLLLSGGRVIRKVGEEPRCFDERYCSVFKLEMGFDSRSSSPDFRWAIYNRRFHQSYLPLAGCRRERSSCEI
jgi:hypothetical protein